MKCQKCISYTLIDTVCRSICAGRHAGAVDLALYDTKKILLQEERGVKALAKRLSKFNYISIPHSTFYAEFIPFCFSSRY